MPLLSMSLARPATCLLLAFAVSHLAAASARPEPAKYAPHVDDSFPTQVYWGDTHVHSAFSMDANALGNSRLTPADAYRFARGESVEGHNGMIARLETPLDFLVVADHTEYMGLLPKLRAADPTVLSDPAGRRLHESLKADGLTGRKTLFALIASKRERKPIIDNQSFQQSIWDEITQTAERFNDPGRFTALIGFEWTSMPSGDNLHRVVIYRDDAEKARQMLPISSFDSEQPEDLWSFMETYESRFGGQVLAIPHNGNLSNGRLFAIEDSRGRPFDDAYATRRARHEPLVEVTQIKGDGETHPLLSPDDEFADFETWDFGNMRVPPIPKSEDMLKWEYVRSTLKHGLEERARIGVNPFKLGLIGGTDAHTSLATADENNFWGKMTSMEPGPERFDAAVFENPEAEIRVMPWDFVASGYAAVWAHENSRAALFDAMRRKEVYATTGPRITLRFFGGWHFEAEDAYRPDAVRVGYREGVPMGGDFPARSERDVPTFLVSAIKDPRGANLDRIQIVKGWLDENGDAQEKVYDVVLGGEKRTGLFGGVRPIASSVDVAEASYANDVGAAELLGYWQDPDFDASQDAFYYVRVLEIPTPRWTAYDAKRFDLDLPDEVPMITQERAYSSPIWYSAD